MLRRVTRLVPLVVAALAASAVTAGCAEQDEPVASGPTLKVLYRAESQRNVAVFDEVSKQLAAVGVRAEGVPRSNADYNRTVTDPRSAERGTWDVAVAARTNSGADDTRAFLAPVVGEQQAEDGAQGDSRAMADAEFFPIAEPKQAVYAAPSIGGRVYVPAFQNYDPTRVTKKGADRRTLHLVGGDDVDVMDPNLSYYSVGFLGLRLWTRQLYAFSADPARPALDLAASTPVMSTDPATGATRATVILRDGSAWGSAPARPVTGADVVRGVKRSCNPVRPYPGTSRYVGLVEGLAAFCADFAALGTDADVEEIRGALDQDVAGLQANANSVTFTFTQPGLTSANVVALLSQPAFAPAPEEFLADLPGSLRVENMVASGPYRVRDYEPGTRIVLVPNPAWTQGADPVRRQNFREVVVDQTHPNQAATQALLQRGGPGADMAWDSLVPPQSLPALLRDRAPELTLHPTYALDPYLVFNTSPASVLADVEVRRSVSRALDRAALVEAIGGPRLNVPMTHLLPPGMPGSRPTEDLYPYAPEQAAAELAELLR